MEEQLKEIEGTLARTKERKSTILYKHFRKRSEEERLAKLGVRSIPRVPSEVDDVRVVKFALYQINRELGEKKALISNSSRLSIEKDGEAQVRAVNNDINKLIRQKSDWTRRLNDILGRANTDIFSSKKVFFGCSRFLPEATNSEVQKEKVHTVITSSDATNEDSLSNYQDSEDEIEDNSFEQNESFSETYLSLIANMVNNEESLLQAEKAIESVSRNELKERPLTRVRYDPDFVADFVSSENNFPSEDHFKLLLTERRKKVALARIQQLRR